MINYYSGKIEDLEVILDLENKCFNKHDSFSKKTILNFLKNPSNSIFLDIILYDDIKVGYAVYLTKNNSNKVRLYSICILPNFNGKGIAASYLEQKIFVLSESFCQISLEVRASNKHALNIYLNLGFHKQKVLPSYYKDGEMGYRLIKGL